MRKSETACLVVNFSRMLAKNSVASLISFFSFACFASRAEIFSSSRCLAFVSPRTMRFRLAFAVDATGKVVNVGSTGYGSLISYETVHCICQCHVLRVYEIENRFQIIYRRRWIGEYLLDSRRERLILCDGIVGLCQSISMIGRSFRYVHPRFSIYDDLR